jgi:hypothetical protein
MSGWGMLGRALALALPLCGAAWGGAWATSPPGPPTGQGQAGQGQAGQGQAARAQVPARSFTSPEEAVRALVEALRANDMGRLRAVFGSAGERVIVSGDSVADRQGRAAFLAAYDAKHRLAMEGEGRASLVIGVEEWPFPVPLVRVASGWRFDAQAGAQEIVNRRIGRNELLTIRTLLAMVAAQQDYFDRVKRGSGEGAYAQRFLSSAGRKDGLFWPAEPGGAASPLGPLLDQAEEEGYPGGTQRTGAQTPYHGYLFRMLTAQGAQAPGGARDYLQGGRMTGGFAIVAWPARYGSTGVVTFLVNADGVVFQKDLGPATAKTVAAMKAFDPDLTWARVDVSD